MVIRFEAVILSQQHRFGSHLGKPQKKDHKKISMQCAFNELDLKGRDGPWPDPCILLTCSKLEANPPLTQELFWKKFKYLVFLGENFKTQTKHDWPDLTWATKKLTRSGLGQKNLIRTHHYCKAYYKNQGLNPQSQDFQQFCKSHTIQFMLMYHVDLILRGIKIGPCVYVAN